MNMKPETAANFPTPKSFAQNDVKVSFNQNEVQIDKYPSVVNMDRQNKVSNEIPAIMDIKDIKQDKQIRAHTPVSRIMNPVQTMTDREHQNYYKVNSKIKDVQTKKMPLKNPSFIENSINIQRFNTQSKLADNRALKNEMDFKVNKITESNKEIDNFIEKSLLFTPENIKDSM